MKVKDLIKLIKDLNLEDYEFCVADRQNGYIKKSVLNTILHWHTAYEICSNRYDTHKTGNSKIAILID